MTASTTEKPAFSFANLSIEDAELPKGARGNKVSKYAGNPLTPAFKASIAGKTTEKDGSWKGKGKAVVVPAAQVPDVEAMVRYCATEAGVGSQIRYLTVKSNTPLASVVTGGTIIPGKDGKADRRQAGTGTHQMQSADGKKYTGDVRVIFAAKSPKIVKEKAKEAPKTDAPAPVPSTRTV